MPSELCPFYSLAVENGDYIHNLRYSIFQMTCSKRLVFRLSKLPKSAVQMKCRPDEMPMTGQKACDYRFLGYWEDRIFLGLA